MYYINSAYGDLPDLAKAYKSTYLNAEPFPNINFRNFFNEELLNGVLEECVKLRKGEIFQLKSPNEDRYGTKGEEPLGNKTKEFIHYLNSEPFVQFIQELTGIEEALIPDPYLDNAGFFETHTGGFLKVHTDYHKHSLTKLDRRVNVLIYLNKNWRSEYGGLLELWNPEITHCVKKIIPEFNTMVIFNTTDYSFHGSPVALKCPPDRSKKLLNLYYFSNGRPLNEVNDGLASPSPIYKARKGVLKDFKMKTYNVLKSSKNFLTSLTPPIFMGKVKKSV